METCLLINELLKGSDNIWMSIHIDPFSNILSRCNLPDHEVLAEIFMIYNEAGLRNNLLNLKAKVDYQK